MNYKKYWYRNLVVALLLSVTAVQAQMIVSTAWGDYACDDELIEQVIASPVMQRMKDIAVAGPTFYLGMVPDYSRYNHSIGVWWLLKTKACADKKEQLAGLLHDTSHTVFSHLGDIVFGKGDGDKSYQDTIHLWFLSHYQDLITLLDAQGLMLEQMDPDHPDYRALEQPLPDLCADRIEYNLHTGIVFGRISKEDACAVIDALDYQDGFWFFTDQDKAKQFAQLPLHFTKHIWGGHENMFVYYCFGQAVAHALKTGLLSHEIMHFGGDTQVMDIVRNAQDPVIKYWFARAADYKNQYTVVDYGKGTINSRPKCRAVDPFVRQDDGTYARLSEIDDEFAQELYDLKEWCKIGYGISFAS